MNKKLLISRLSVMLILITSTKFIAQVGINTANPKATLHVLETNKSSPTLTDGILVPRVATLPATGNEAGQLLFLNTSVGNDTTGFYVWTGTAWDKLHEESIVQDIDKSITVAMGTNTSTTYLNHGNSNLLLFSTLRGYDTSGMSISGNKITIGKTGTYLITVTSSLKTQSTTTDGHRASFLYQIRHTSGSNVTYPSSAMSSIPNQAITATNISFSDIINLKQGDTLEVTRQRINDAESQQIQFLPYGNNTLRLTFLQ